jgi:hypothetical protein
MRWMWVILAGCTGTDPKDSGQTGDSTAPGDDWQLQSYVDEGALCFEGTATEVTVWVDPQLCLSSSCSRAFQGSCTATLADTTITVTSDISWEQNVGVGVDCTDDCGSTAVSCTLPPLADGTYTVLFGTEQVELVIPTTQPCSQ